MRNWTQFNPDSAEASLPLNDEEVWANVEQARHRLDENFISQWADKLRSQREKVAQRLGKTGLFWSR